MSASLEAVNHDRQQSITTSADEGALTVFGCPRDGWRVKRGNELLAHYRDVTDPYDALQKYRKQREEARRLRGSE